MSAEPVMALRLVKEHRAKEQSACFASQTIARVALLVNMEADPCFQVGQTDESLVVVRIYGLRGGYSRML